MKHNLIQPRAKHITPILASKKPLVGWAVVLGFPAAAALLLLMALADGAVAPFFTTTVLVGVR